MSTDQPKSTTHSSQALSLTLAVVPERSRVGEKVEAKVALQNPGGGPVVVNGRMALNSAHAPQAYRELTFEIKGPAGDELPFQAKVRIGAPGPEDVRTLASGEKIDKSYALSDYFALEQPGSYTVRAHYASAPVTNASGEAAWTEPVSSEMVKLERAR